MKYKLALLVFLTPLLLIIISPPILKGILKLDKNWQTVINGDDIKAYKISSREVDYIFQKGRYLIKIEENYYVLNKRSLIKVEENYYVFGIRNKIIWTYLMFSLYLISSICLVGNIISFIFLRKFFKQ